MNRTFPTLRAIAIAVALIVLVFLCVPMNRSARALAMLAEPTTSQLTQALHRVCLDPRNLTAAGVSSSTVDDVIDDVRQYLTDNPGVLESADEDWVQAKQACIVLKQHIQAGLATPGEVNSYGTAVSDLASAETARNAVLTAVFSAGIEDLTSSQQSVLAQLRANQGRKLPTEFLIVDRTDAAWAELDDALADEHVADKLGIDPDPDCQSLLQIERASTPIATAKSYLSTNLTLVTSAWDSAVGL